MGEDFDSVTKEELMERIAMQMFYMQRNFEDTHDLLESMALHFYQICENFNQAQLYDHSVTLNQDLFQRYFNMSISIAHELNYLESKDDELEQALRQ